MSKCMTIDETVDQKDICIDIAPKEIVEFILEEALLSAFIVSDKGCSRIGDSNITNEFRQQYDQLTNQKDFEQVEPSQALPTANRDSNLNFRESLDRALPAKGNLELIIDSFVKEEEKTKPLNDCQVISEEVLADNELQIKNGQIHLEKNKTEKSLPESTRQEYFDKEDIIRDEKIEIEYFNKGQLNKIYVPLNVDSSSDIRRGCGSTQGEDASEEKKEENEEDTERPFKPFTTEDLRQSTLKVWENGNSSLVGRWDGNMLSQRDEVVRIMEELSSVQVFPDSFVDPNRPRACAFGEEDVKKMTKEIEDINFTPSHTNSEDSNASYLAEGQGDAELKSDTTEKSQNEFWKTITSNQSFEKSKEFEKDEKHSTFSSKEEIQTLSDQMSSNSIQTMDSKEENCLIVSFDDMRNSVGENKSLMKVDFTLTTEPKPESINDEEDGMIQERSEIFQSNSFDRNECDLTKEFFPGSMSLPKNTESFNENEQKLGNQDLTPDLDLKFNQESPGVINEFENGNDTQANVPDPHHQTQQGTITWNGLKWGSNEAVCTLSLNSFHEEKHLERLVVDFNPLAEEAEEKIKSSDAENFLQKTRSQLDECKSNFGMIQNGEDTNLNAEKISERLEDNLICAEKKVENVEKLEESGRGDETELLEAEREKKSSDVDINFELVHTAINGQESKKSLDEEDALSNMESNQGPSTSSQTQVTDQPTYENEFLEPSDALVSGSQKFKLHSQKMYLSPYHEPAGQVSNEFNLTESEEAFIDMSENVIQIIEPPENSADEDSNVISFSLLPESPNLKSASLSVENKSELSIERKDSSENETKNKKLYSGMTTIGPMKNMDYDPKDLMAPEIDYGKMTRITSSRQLARDMGLLNSEINTAMSVKIIEENDSDDNTSLNVDDDHADRTSLVNRDIASLTKVQKVREVMSYQAKPDEDFEDEESLPRPRLDLKDVESMTDERYKFPDVNIPLLSLEISDRNIEAEKELIESMGLVISGLTNACFYEEDSEDNMEIQRKYSADGNDTGNGVEPSSTNAVNKQNSKIESLEAEENVPKNLEKEKSKVEFSEKVNEENSEREELEVKTSLTERKDSQHEDSENTKYSTLGNVFRKASSKFMRKDSELYMRNSKSLPRDTNKITATNSIRSILDDCQSSASNMLKKSCSLLKNTESIFKSISQSMVTSDRNSDPNTNTKKLSPSESDVSTIERKFSGFFKKEDFTKAKNLIKSKVEKTFKNSDTETASALEPKTSSEKKDLRLAVRNEENLRIDRIENFKKLLPKSPLVYKSQFVKSQSSFQNQPEPEVFVQPTAAQPQPDETVNVYSVEDSSVTAPEKKKESLEDAQSSSIYSQENVQWIAKQDDMQSPANENLELQQPDFIVMETIQGLPASDLESPSSEKENLNVENTGKILTKKGNDLKKIESSNSLQIFTDNTHDVAPCFPEVDEEKTATKTPSERKIKTKKKKFTARFRSFWCTAFGRAKTPQKKGDIS